MPVFDPRQGQVLFSPVTNYYQGKAIRQEQADREQMAEMRDLQIDEAKYQQSPERRAKQEELAEMQIEAARVGLNQAEITYGKDKMGYLAKSMAPIMESITPLLMSGDEEGAIAQFNEQVNALLPTMPKDLQKAVLESGGADHVYDMNEIADTATILHAWQEQNDVDYKETEFLLDGKPVKGSFWGGNYYMPDGRLAVGDIQPITKKPMVQINNAGETEATKAYGKKIGERAAERDQQAEATYQEDANLTRIELALERGARTGFGEDILLDIRGALDTLGVVDLPESAQESEVIRSLGNILALRLRNPESGLGLTGNTSNKDLSFLMNSVAGIARSEGGNKLLIRITKKLNQFKRDIATEQSRIIAENDGVVPNDLNSQLMKYANDYELLTKQEREMLERASSEEGSDEDTSEMEVEDMSDNTFRKEFKKAYGFDPQEGS